jgi:hypothetical protein
VAAQILLEWSELVKLKQEQLIVYCNAQHLQIHEGRAGKQEMTIEWVGDKRNYDGSVSKLHASAGETKTFHHVIMAVGYGLEKDNTRSYWRNDTLGQPSLAEPRRSFLVSGQGDGAMIEVHEELKRRGVTLMILWEEHRAGMSTATDIPGFAALRGMEKAPVADDAADAL